MIRVSDLCFSVGAFSLKKLSLEIARGEYFVLLGPTGAGKTLFIEALCGLLRPSSGRIEIDGRDVTELAPRLRGVGYVPQNSGLFPHLDVRRNIAFPLRARRVGRDEVRRRIAPLVEMLGLEPLLGRWPANLSGGERQKVALARALAGRPRLLVLDEPVSALDEPSRERLCTELRSIQRELGVTTIHVSHNVEEALSVGDRAGILQDGCLVQAGLIAELLRRPANEFVARFFRAENIFQAEATPLSGSASRLLFAGNAVRAAGWHEGRVTFVIRPEAVAVHPPGSEVPNAVEAELKRITDRGPYRRLEFDAGTPIVAYATAETRAFQPCVGLRHVLAFPTEAIHVLPQEQRG